MRKVEISTQLKRLVHGIAGELVALKIVLESLDEIYQGRLMSHNIDIIFGRRYIGDAMKEILGILIKANVRYAYSPSSYIKGEVTTTNDSGTTIPNPEEIPAISPELEREAEVLRGVKKILEKYKPDILIHVYQLTSIDGKAYPVGSVFFFVESKAGKSRLSQHQKEIRKLIQETTGAIMIEVTVGKLRLPKYAYIQINP